MMLRDETDVRNWQSTPKVSSFSKSYTQSNADEICEACVCRIEVGATPVSPTTAWHTFIVFTDTSGRMTIFRGGPQTGNPFSKRLADDLKNDGASDIVEETFRGLVKSRHELWHGEEVDPFNAILWGGLIVHRGPFGPGTPDYEAWMDTGQELVIVSQGPETCRKYSSLILTASKIARGGYQYGPFGDNCNRATSTWLKEAGLPFLKPDVWAPRFGEPLW